jgi:hypothetical protein
VALATKPFTGSRIESTTKAGSQLYFETDDTLEVTVTNGIAQSTIQAEETIYEVAMSLRVGGDADLDAPYNVVRIGGASTRRVAVRLNENVVIDTERRRVEVWNSGRTSKVADVPVFAIDAREVLNVGGSEVAAQRWLPMQAYQNPLENPDFATNLTDWSRVGTGTGVTAAAASRVAGTPNYMLSQVTASTGASGISAIRERADDFLLLGSNGVARIAADLYTTNVNLVPRLTIWFYDAAQTLIGSENMETLYTPIASTWYRRAHQVVAPAGAKYYRVGLTVWTTAANATGSVRSAAYAPDANELIVRDEAIGQLTVSAEWLAMFL